MATRRADDRTPHARDHGQRKHRGKLCLQCFHDRRVSEDAAACAADERWLTYPTTTRARREPYVSR